MKLNLMLSVIGMFIFMHTQAQKDSTVIGPPNTPQRFSKPTVDFPNLPKSQNKVTYDLIISNLSIGNIVTDHRNGTPIKMREMKYTIKNLGTGSIPLNRVVVQGYVGYDDVYTIENMTPACGKIVNLGSDTLLSGTSYSDSFKCPVDSYWTGMKYYLLRVDEYNSIPETNENNNTKLTNLN